MKAIIEVKFKKVRNVLTGKDIIIDDKLSIDENFRKAVVKNLKIICDELENYFKKKRIVTEFKFYLDNGR
jgi:hypothetical protein